MYIITASNNHYAKHLGVTTTWIKQKVNANTNGVEKQRHAFVSYS